MLCLQQNPGLADHPKPHDQASRDAVTNGWEVAWVPMPGENVARD